MTQITPEAGRPDAVPAVAATVVLLRDGADGPEVLLLERPSNRGSFAGAWVFPGGGVDPEDLVDPVDEESIARRAAVREVREETGLAVPEETLVATACWIPPEGAPKRLRTWFYYALAPAGEIVLAPQECVDHVWLRPVAALERHAAGTLSLVPPTWVTLAGLTHQHSVEEVLAAARRGNRQRYAGRFGTHAGGPAIFWTEDVAFTDDALADADGDRHRLEMAALPWVYSRSFDSAE